jgi:Bacterial Ig domain
MNTKFSRKAILIVILALALTLVASPALAQTSLKLNLRRDFGYGSGSQVRGTFTLSVAGPSDLQSVIYKIDGATMQEVTASPFSYQFNTGSYPTGWHDLTASATTSSGAALESNVLRFDFVTASQESAGMQRILLPLGGVVVGLLVIMLLFQFVAFRGKKPGSVPLGAERKYGVAGGTICSKCGRPTPMHMWGINAGITTKLDRCENCGKWSVMKRMPIEELRRAEQAELRSAENGAQVHAESPEEKLRHQLDDSRYEEH